MIEHSHCCYCRRKFSQTEKHLKKTKDHFVPVSRTGNGEENILQCCYECNQWKDDKMPEFWLNRVGYFKDRRRKLGNYEQVDYSQIIGSLRHWIKYFSGKLISDYKNKL